jgi:uncharacterized membrane protein YeaQ/YmgE (transglycosylase-associated protein family)
MSIVSWIVLGLVAGTIANLIVNKRGDGLLFNLVLGIVGAMIGGSLFRLLGTRGVTGMNVHSLVSAALGALIVLVAFRIIQR